MRRTDRGIAKCYLLSWFCSIFSFLLKTPKPSPLIVATRNSLFFIHIFLHSLSASICGYTHYCMPLSNWITLDFSLDLWLRAMFVLLSYWLTIDFHLHFWLRALFYTYTLLFNSRFPHPIVATRIVFTSTISILTHFLHPVMPTRNILHSFHLIDSKSNCGYAQIFYTLPHWFILNITSKRGYAQFSIHYYSSLDSRTRLWLCAVIYTFSLLFKTRFHHPILATRNVW